MKRFVKFEIHEYMDEYPIENIQMWEGANEEMIKVRCLEYTEHMCNNYSGGTTRFIKILTEEEAQQWLFNKISEEIEKYHDEDAISNIQRMCEMYKESYK